MKRVILLRHAKSDWNAGYGSDHDRPLNKRGRRAAARMGRYLAAIGQLPDLVIGSTALRARDTVERAAAAGGWERPVELTPEFYEAAPETVLQRIRILDESAESVLIAGHEPTWSLLVEMLVGGGNVRMPTAAMTRVDFAVDRWSGVDAGAGELIWHVTPKLLERLGFEPEP